MSTTRTTRTTTGTAHETAGAGGVPDAGASGPGFHPDPAKVARAIAKRSFCTLATTSPSGRPHAAGILYAVADGALYVSTLRTSRKARNIAENPRVGVVIPVRRLPVGPPSSVQFQAVAEILGVDDPGVRRLAGAGRLKAITGHGELELPDGCVVRITPPRRVLTYGLGMSLRRLVRDPLDAAGAVELDLA
ncbi:MAG TPA: pyridoxamine 5'-phosphate oxidase family protein [Acidimicrobiales bacterium]